MVPRVDAGIDWGNVGHPGGGVVAFPQKYAHRANPNGARRIMRLYTRAFENGREIHGTGLYATTPTEAINHALALKSRFHGPSHKIAILDPGGLSAGDRNELRTSAAANGLTLDQSHP